MCVNFQRYVSRFIKGDLFMLVSVWIEEIYVLCYYNLYIELKV